MTHPLGRSRSVWAPWAFLHMILCAFFWPIQNEIPRDDDHTGQHESLEWESPLFPATGLLRDSNIPSAYFKAGTEKIKSQREAKKQTSRLGNRASKASSCKALVSGINALCFFSDGVRDSAISAFHRRACFPCFRLFLPAFSRSCLRAASISRDSGLALIGKLRLYRKLCRRAAVCYFVCLISRLSPGLAINLDLCCASQHYPANG
jgi:hypothetical protein